MMAFSVSLFSQDEGVTFTKEQVKELAKFNKDLNKQLRQAFNGQGVFAIEMDDKAKLKWKQGALTFNDSDSLFIVRESAIRPQDALQLNWERYFYDIQAVTDTLGNTEVVLIITPK